MKSARNKYNSDYTELLIPKSKVRSFIRRSFYIKNILNFVNDKTIDFGCGVGEILKYLPADSIGIDPNMSSIEHCKKNNLKAECYNPESNNYSLDSFRNKGYKTILMNHVLEHIASPKNKFNKIIKEAADIDIKRIIVVVPCKKGFLADPTHEQYIESDFFNSLQLNKYKVIHKKYFPINNKLIGDFFRYQELIIVLEKSS